MDVRKVAQEDANVLMLSCSVQRCVLAKVNAIRKMQCEYGMSIEPIVLC